MTRPIALATSLAVLLLAPVAWAEEMAAPAEETAAPAESPALRSPKLANEQAPEKFKVEFDTTAGPITVEVTRAWAPNGADRFYNLVKIGFFRDIAFFRVIPNFMAQFGIHGDPVVSQRWRAANIEDDPVVESNQRGYITYAKTNRPNSRSTQFFINFRHNKNLDRMGFAPFGKVVDGMDVVDAIYAVGEGKPRGPGPSQQMVQSQGNPYLKREYPDLTYIKSAKLVE